MKPVKFKEHNCVYAKDQPEYTPLPAFLDPRDDLGRVTFCMGLNLWERLRLLVTGRVWCTLQMGRDPRTGLVEPLTPSSLSTRRSDMITRLKRR